MASTLLNSTVLYSERSPTADVFLRGSSQCAIASATFAVVYAPTTAVDSYVARLYTVNPTTGTVLASPVFPGDPASPPQQVRLFPISATLIGFVSSNARQSTTAGDVFVGTVDSAGTVTVSPALTLPGLLENVVYLSASNGALASFNTGGLSGTSFSARTYRTFDLATADYTSVDYDPPSSEQAPVPDNQNVYSRVSPPDGLLDRFTGGLRTPLPGLAAGPSAGTLKANVDSVAVQYPTSSGRQIALVRDGGVLLNLPLDQGDQAHAFWDLAMTERFLVTAGGLEIDSYSAASFGLYARVARPDGSVEELEQTWPFPPGYPQVGAPDYNRYINYYAATPAVQGNLLMVVFEGDVTGYDPVADDSDNAFLLSFALWDLGGATGVLKVLDDGVWRTVGCPCAGPGELGRLKLTDGTAWVVDQGSRPGPGHQLKALVNGTWTVVACMVPDA